MNVYGGERGEIVHRGRSQQIVSWRGIRYGQITPSDIDGIYLTRGVIEYQSKAWVFFEFKHKDAPPIQTGQLRMFNEMCAQLERPALYLICEHDVSDASADIIAAESIVVSCRTKNNEWRQPTNPTTAKQASDQWIAKFS